MCAVGVMWRKKRMDSAGSAVGKERGRVGWRKGGEEERRERRSGTCKWSGLRDGCKCEVAGERK